MKFKITKLDVFLFFVSKSPAVLEMQTQQCYVRLQETEGTYCCYLSQWLLQAPLCWTLHMHIGGRPYLEELTIHIGKTDNQWKGK